jgi:hypothetical protein
MGASASSDRHDTIRFQLLDSVLGKPAYQTIVRNA